MTSKVSLLQDSLRLAERFKSNLNQLLSEALCHG